MSGFYFNELLLKLTERCDPHPEIFLLVCLLRRKRLCGGEVEEPALRRFEKRLLDELGYGLELSRTGDGVPVRADGYYRFAPQSGPQPCVAEAPGAVYGRSLADLQAESFEDARSLRDAKRVLRAAIDACLDGRVVEIPRGHAGHAAPRAAARGACLSIPERRARERAELHGSIALGVNIDHVATLAPGAPRSLSGSPARGASRRASGRRQHHAAPARGPPPHPGSRRDGDAPGFCRPA